MKHMDKIEPRDETQLEARLSELERVAHEPFDFTHLIHRIETLEAGMHRVEQENERLSAEVRRLRSKVNGLHGKDLT